jgi:hypothetical protein
MEIAYTPHAPSSMALEYIQATIPEWMRAEIRERIKAKKDKFNEKLVGHIKEEWGADLSSWKPWHDMIHELMHAYDQNYPSYTTHLIEQIGEFRATLDDPWVNYMYKHEYNPVHQHSGLFSYVAWISIPYSLEDEAKNFPDINECNNGAFCFVSPSADGTTEHTIRVDKSYEWEIVLFRARQQHCVYPFFTSDEPRISIAGNVILDDRVEKMMPS